MLTQIKAKPAGPRAASLADALASGDTSDAVDLLLGCHQRIRHFTAMAVRLSRPNAPAEQIPAAAQAVYKYYSQALPLHEADENDSVYPRLRKTLAATSAEQWDPARHAIADANQTMVDQHAAINIVVAELLPLWRALPDDPAAAPRTSEMAQRLETAWNGHLELEERLIFPALRELLDPESRTAIRQEMAARRH